MIPTIYRMPMLPLHVGWCLPLPIPSSYIVLPTQKLMSYPTLKLTTHTLPDPKTQQKTHNQHATLPQNTPVKWCLGCHFVYGGDNLQFVGSRVMDTTNYSVVKPIINALATGAARIVHLEPHFILWEERWEGWFGWRWHKEVVSAQGPSVGATVGIGRSFGA